MPSTPSRKKGTAAETELKRRLEYYGIQLARTAPGTKYDLVHLGNTGRTLELLATRPDRGEWLVSMRLDDFAHLAIEHGDGLHIEVKRYKDFRHHRIFKEKFG